MKKNIKNLPVKYTLYFFMLILTGSWCDSKEVTPSNNSVGNTSSIKEKNNKTAEQQKNNAPGTGSTAATGKDNTGKPEGAAGTRGREAEKEKEAGPREGEGSEAKETEPGMGSAATKLETRLEIGSEAKEAERETGEKEAGTGAEREEKIKEEEDDDDGEINKLENGNNDNNENKEEEQTTEPKEIDFTTYLNGLEKLENNMVEKHSELKEAFTYFKAMQQLVLRLASNQENFINSIIHKTLDNLKQQEIKKLKEWQETRKTKLSKVISSLQAFYNDAIKHMNIIQQIVEEAKNYKKCTDNQTKNVLEIVNKTINEYPISDLLGNTEKRASFKRKLEKMALSKSSFENNAKNKLQPLSYHITAIIAKSETVREDIQSLL